MKKLALIITGAAFSLAAALPAQAELSANAGFVSDYYFRGANLGDGGAYAGLDYESDGFFAGTWWIDDGTGGNDGFENDWYIGYGGGDDAFSWSLGYNSYQYSYSKDFEHEIVVGLNFSGFGVEFVKGSDEDDQPTFIAGALEDSQAYSVASLSYAAGAFTGTAGYFEFDDIDDADYQWLELSWGGSIVEGIDASVTLGKTFVTGIDTDGYMVLDISKSFEL